jgi:uncharacterized membrane protein (DUF106 family)
MPKAREGSEVDDGKTECHDGQVLQTHAVHLVAPDFSIPVAEELPPSHGLCCASGRIPRKASALPPHFGNHLGWFGWYILCSFSVSGLIKILLLVEI